MEKYLEIGKVNLKHSLLPHIIAAAVFCLLSTVLMGTENLDEVRTAQVLEQYIDLLGIIILVPIFLPDQDKIIRDLIKSKTTAFVKVHFIRIIEEVIILSIFVGIFIIFLNNRKCVFPIGMYFAGTMAGAIFLGGLGILIYSMVDNIAVAYMVPLVYYMMNFGASKKLLNHFYLFSMSRGSYTEKVYLAIAGLIFITAGILYRHLNKN